jgi:uncharacterized membrane protein YcjF (UPF0283 family)
MNMNHNSEPCDSVHSDDDEFYDEKEEIDRDEVKEVRNMSSKETSRIIFWRVVVTLVLLLTAFAVTFATYTFLRQQEHKNFKAAVRCVQRKILSKSKLVDHVSLFL